MPENIPEQLIEHVSDTAFWVAHYRAIEGARPDALFHDPLAGVLAGERGKRIALAMPPTFCTAVVLRTCVIDDYILDLIGCEADGFHPSSRGQHTKNPGTPPAAEERAGLPGQRVDTILNLGAGLDTRPYRMKLPESLRWIEADYPHMIEFKQERLANEKPRCRLERVKVDLADPKERRRMLTQIDTRAEKMLVLTEGVVPFLSEEQAASLADDLRAMAHVRYWVLDYVASQVVNQRVRNATLRQMQDALFKFVPEDWWGFFDAHGWKAKEVRYLMPESQKRNRPVELPPLTRAMFYVRGFFMSREKQEASMRSAGYVLLEPTDPS